jgi:Zn finger protein HypA/HybF involved in hydrogenase expression
MTEKTKEELSGKAGSEELGPGAFVFKCPRCDHEISSGGKKDKQILCPKCSNPMKATDIEDDEEYKIKQR